MKESFPMTIKKHFYDVLEAFVERGNYKNRQLDHLSALRFGQHQHIPHETISRWRRGIVKKPRMWQDLVKLAIVLNLTESEADELLTAAKHYPIAVLRKMASNEADKRLLSFWDKKKRPLVVPQAPFQAPFQAPPDQPDFTGRRAELRIFKEGLRPPQYWGGKEGGAQVRIFCVQGMAGVGKTTLAIHLAYQLRDAFPDGVLWSQLERSDTMSVLRSFADAYGHDVSVYSDLGSRSSKVRELLAGKRVLMVLDNASEDEQIRPLLPPTGSCGVIITTRRHDLWVADSAHRIRLQPFSEEKEESLALFARVLGDGRAQKERAALIDIADLLGHLPLAIAIAANRIKNDPWGSATKLLKRLEEQQRPLKELKRGSQGVRLSFDLSYHALPPDLQRFFATLGVFEGEDFTVEAAAYVAELPIEIEDAEDYLRELYTLSLLQLGRAERYKLHPLLRDYSREQMPHARPFERMVSFFVDYIVKHQTDYAVLDSEMGNLLGALEVASEQGMKAALVRGVIASYEFLQTRGLYEQAKSYLKQAEQAARELGDVEGQATILRHLGRIAIRLGNPKQAQERYQEGIALARQTGNKKLISALLTSLGALADRRGQLEQARTYYEEGVTLAEEISDELRIAVLQTNLAIIAVKQGHYTSAKSNYQLALQRFRRLDHKEYCAHILQNLGELVEQQGDYEKAGHYLREGLALAKNLRAQELQSCLLGNLGVLACAQQEYDKAITFLKEGLKLANSSNLIQQISRQQANFGLLATCQQNYVQANSHYAEALKLARQNDFSFDICAIQNQWGQSYLAQEKWVEAESAFSEAQELAYTMNFEPEKAHCLAGLARIAAKRNHIQKAKALAQESWHLFEKMGHRRAGELKSGHSDSPF